MENGILRDAYEKYRNAGFILQKAAKHKKHAFREGAYCDRVNEPFEDNATGYVGIIPPTLIIVDNDRYKDNGESFKQLLKDLKFEGTPTPFAFTPSGGEHYAFQNHDSTLVIGNLGDTYPALDIYAGYQSVLPIVGTTVRNKQGELAVYTWGDEIYEDFVINGVTDFDHFKKVLKMRERLSNTEKEYDEDARDLSVAIKNEEMPDEEVNTLLESLSSDLSYDDWCAVAMCLYDRYEGGDEGLEKLQKFGEKSPDKNDPVWTESKWRNGHFKPTRTSYTRLRSIGNEAKVEKILVAIGSADSKKLNSIIKKISKIPQLNTRGKLDQEIRDQLSEKINTQFKNLKKNDASTQVIQARTIRKQIEHAISVEDLKEEGKEIDVKVYVCGNRFTLRIGNILMEDLSESFVKKHLAAYGVSYKVAEAYIRDAQIISEVVMTTDYMLDKPIDYTLKESNAIERLPILTILKDPFHSVKNYIDDEDIIHDFYNEVWNGKALDIIELIALTIKFKEWKLNRLMIVAPSDTGKTTLMEHLGFQKIHMQRLLAAMRGDKGIGRNVIDGVKNSGLLLIDEANKSLEQDIKDMDREIYVDEFGAGGGTQKIRLHFTALTSTHKTATRNSSDELYNRFLQIELTQEEMHRSISKSNIYRRDTEKYSEVIKTFAQYHFKKCLKNSEYDREYLQNLQAKYRLPINSDLDEFLYQVSGEVIDYVLTNVTDNEDVIERGGEYYIRRKTDLRNVIEDSITQLPSIDSGKYSDMLLNHFIQSQVKSIKIDNKSVKYYPIVMRTFILNEDDKIIDMFDDLEEN